MTKKQGRTGMQDRKRKHFNIMRRVKKPNTKKKLINMGDSIPTRRMSESIP